jgi:hypothetical protein
MNGMICREDRRTKTENPKQTAYYIRKTPNLVSTGPFFAAIANERPRIYTNKAQEKVT